MDPKRLGNAMLGLNDYTTADVLNQPIRRGAILPWTEYADRSEFDPTSGLPGALYNALMAPARAYRGEISEDQQIPEAFNFAGNLTLGSLLSGAAAPVKARAMSAYKAMGPEDSPAHALTTTRISGANRFMFDDPANGVYDNAATAFANQRPSASNGKELLDALYGRGMGPANSNSATAELFANAKTGAAVPLATKALEAQQPKGIKAFHGSPHDFDKFSMDKIGTGEGAQAYGHGLYFAEAEDVAKTYREPVTGGWGGERFTVNGLDEDQLPIHVRQAVASVGKEAGDGPLDAAAIEKALQGARAAVERYEASKDPSVIRHNLPHARDTLRGLEEIKGAKLGRKQIGHMYEVRINADPQDFLDWDRPLSQQPKIAEVAKRLAPDVPQDVRQYAAHTLYSPEFLQGLREAGIPGIKYLDQMSRGAGEGSSNYVVFDDALIEIMRKYGLLGPVAAGTVAAATNDEGPIY